MALPSRVVDQGRIRREYGCAFALFPGDVRFAIECQRADDDGGGSPDVGTVATVGTMPPGKQLFIDPTPGSQGATFHYRFRHIRTGYDDGEDSPWFAVKSAFLPDEFPLLPSEPNLSADLNIDQNTGDITIEVNAAAMVRSVKWALELVTTTYPAAGTGAAVDTDSSGDVSIATGQTQDENKTARATVTAYSAASGGGTILGTIRISATRGVSDGTGLPPTSGLGEVEWVVSPSDGAGKYHAYLNVQFGENVQSLEIVATDAPLDVNSEYIVNLSAGEKTARSVRHQVKAAVSLEIDPSTAAVFDTDTSDGCLFSITPYDDTDGSLGTGSPGTASQPSGFVPQDGQDVNASGIGSLADVSAAGPSDLDAIVFNNGTGLWEGRALATTDVQSGVLVEARGGTGVGSYVQGDILYADATNSLAALPLGSALEVLRVNAGGTQIEWGTISTLDPAAAEAITGIWTFRHFTPEADSSYNIGTTSNRFLNIYADDLHTTTRLFIGTTVELSSGATNRLDLAAGDRMHIPGGLSVGASASTVKAVNITGGIYAIGGDIICNNAALATTATDGFLYIPTSAGTPTGVPTGSTGTVALIYDTTNNKLWVYDGGWIGVALA